MSTKSTMDFAEDFLLRNKAHEEPLDMFELCRKNKIALIPYSAPEARHMAELVGVGDWIDRTDGFAVQIAGTSAIF